MVAGDDGAEAGAGDAAGGDDVPPAPGLGVVAGGGTEAVAGGSACGVESPVVGGLRLLAGGGAEAIAGGEVSGVEADETGFSGGTEASELVSGGGDGGAFEISDEFEDSGNGEA